MAVTLKKRKRDEWTSTPFSSLFAKKRAKAMDRGPAVRKSLVLGRILPTRCSKTA